MHPQQQQPSVPNPYGQAGPALLGPGVSLKNGWAFGTGLSILILYGLFGLLFLVGFVILSAAGLPGKILLIVGLVLAVVFGLAITAGFLTMKEKFAGYIIGLVIMALGVLGNVLAIAGDGNAFNGVGAGINCLFIFLFIMCIKRHNELKPLREQAKHEAQAARSARRGNGPRRNLNPRGPMQPQPQYQQPMQQYPQQGYAQPQPQYQQPVQQQYAQPAQAQPQYAQPEPQQMPAPQQAVTKPAMSSKQAAMSIFLLAAGLEADKLEARKMRALAGVKKAFGEKSGAAFSGMVNQLQTDPNGATRIREFIKPIVNANNDRLPPSVVKVATYILKEDSAMNPVAADFIRRLESAIADGPQEDTVRLHDPAFQQQLQQPPQQY